MLTEANKDRQSVCVCVCDEQITIVPLSKDLDRADDMVIVPAVITSAAVWGQNDGTKWTMGYIHQTGAFASCPKSLKITETKRFPDEKWVYSRKASQ